MKGNINQVTSLNFGSESDPKFYGRIRSANIKKDAIRSDISDSCCITIAQCLFKLVSSYTSIQFLKGINIFKLI